MEPAASLIVVSYNTREATLACVESSKDVADVEVLVLDNASSDGTVGALQAAYPRARVVAETTNLGFAKACNVGASLARGRYLGFFNSDCIARAGAWRL